ncbi:ATPase [Labilibaculum filiforme]|uniref:ATPase n=1 Tax=Labilibaculum filiforme TaxID=1940526 RepID=A0A2N3HY67_9BACT|nr:ATPase [Labilibaculum filiforme]PKQ63010.1 ATPase [Labilibaculum filiforme]
MEAIYLDLHIHTSVDSNNLSDNYDIETLITKIKSVSKDSAYLISLTDHNIINKRAYLEAKNKVMNLLLGVELHIRNYSECPPYHCHIYFNLDEITEDVIDELNLKLDILYPIKMVSTADKIPTLEEVIKTFDSYDFLILPHGGQSHSTFPKSIPKGVKFDNSIERSIYYNQFDGFTARGNTKLEITQDYFKRLGINEFVNLVTCTDNYSVNSYPNAKAKKAEPFIPTWMFALPTFSGLRLSLSESSRLVYSHDRPSIWSEHIKSVKLDNEKINIDAELTSGLNVVIGGSSSGKTLFVDSLYNKIIGDFSDSKYIPFGVEQLHVNNPSMVKPHYLSQNYIMQVVSDATEDKIDNIEIVRKVFPGDETIKQTVNKGLLSLKTDLTDLIGCVKILEEQVEELSHIPYLTRLITRKDIQKNVIDKFRPTEEEKRKIKYSLHDFKEHNEFLDEIDAKLKSNPFVSHDEKLVIELKKEIVKAFDSSSFAEDIKKVIDSEKERYDMDLKSANTEEQTKRQNFEKLILCVKIYSQNYSKFYKILEKVSKYSIKCDSEIVESMGHKLFIENDFELNKTKLLEVINKLLKTGDKILSFDNISPESLFKSKYKGQSPKVKGYDDFEKRIYTDFESLNKRNYKIITLNGKKFEDLSAGWRTSVLLDIILGFEGDIAPIIIDQPEDNLATNYINEGLVNAIKKIKSKKQIILVSHNATIPMLGDAQNIVLCINNDQKIEIKSNRLEGELNSRSIVDYIAEITDGGKPSIKKRVKKYNLKNFKE